MLRIALLAIVLAGCTTHSRDPARDAYPDLARERAEDSVRRMQDEFNRLFPDA
jgi:hypothetical protein